MRNNNPIKTVCVHLIGSQILFNIKDCDIEEWKRILHKAMEDSVKGIKYIINSDLTEFTTTYLTGWQIIDQKPDYTEQTVNIIKKQFEDLNRGDNWKYQNEKEWENKNEY